MADPTTEPHTLWAWMDWLWGFALGVVGAVTALLGWVNPRFKSIEDQARAMSDQLLKLEGENHATRILYQNLSGGIVDLNRKTDEQTKLLHEVVGELKAIQKERMRGL